MQTVRQRRVLTASKYHASGSGRGINKRNVYLIDGYFYAYHPAYAEEQYTPIEGELKGYIPVNQNWTSISGTFYSACKPNREPHYKGDDYHIGSK